MLGRKRDITPNLGLVDVSATEWLFSLKALISEILRAGKILRRIPHLACELEASPSTGPAEIII